MASTLRSEFEGSQLEVRLSKHDTFGQFKVVLENTGEVIHEKSGKIDFTETQGLMMVSKIGTWLYEQRK